MRANKGRLPQVRVAAVLLALAFAAVAPQAAGNAAALSNIRIDNFGQVSAAYYRGAKPDGRDYSDLAALGVKTVIDLTDDGSAEEPAAVRSQGMQFYRIPMTTHETPSSEKVALFLKLVEAPANQPVYVHCQGGRHRTGVMTAVYRMTDEGWSADRAFTKMKQYNFGPDFLHAEFKNFVYAYHPPVRTPTAPAAILATQIGN